MKLQEIHYPKNVTRQLTLDYNFSYEEYKNQFTQKNSIKYFKYWISMLFHFLVGIDKSFDQFLI